MYFIDNLEEGEPSETPPSASPTTTAVSVSSASSASPGVIDSGRMSPVQTEPEQPQIKADETLNVKEEVQGQTNRNTVPPLNLSAESTNESPSSPSAATSQYGVRLSPRPYAKPNTSASPVKPRSPITGHS